jgi:transposase
MRQRIAELEARLARVTAERDKLRRAYELVKEQLLRRRIYVAKAERVDVQQLELEFAAKKAELERLATQLDEPAPGEPPAQGDAPAPKAKGPGMAESIESASN